MIGRLLAGMAVLLGSAATASPVTIHAGRLLAIPGQPVRGPSTVVVDGGRIVSVTAGYQPAAGRLIDLRDKTVLPGLIDAHVHLDSDRAGNEGLLSEFTDSVPLRAYEAQMNGMKTLRAGFTTVRNLGDGEGGKPCLSRRHRARLGAGAADRLGRAEHLDHRRPHGRAQRHQRRCRCPHGDPSPVRRRGRLPPRGTLQISRGADVIKIATTGGVNSGTGLMTRMEQDEAEALIKTAHAYGKKVAVHSHGRDGTKLALRNGADSIEHGTDMDDETIRLFKPLAPATSRPCRR